MASLTVIRPGLLTTVQDLGRWGLQHLGVPVAGPMDWYAHRLANLAVGNPPEAAALEMTLLGPELQADADIVCAVAGARFEVEASGRRIPCDEPFALGAGERVRFGSRTSGARAVLAVAGGIAVPPVLGSRATSITARLGPFGGRGLRPGDVLPIGRPGQTPPSRGRPMQLPLGLARLRVIPATHEEGLGATAVEALARATYTVTADSNRMGYRLDGPRLEHAAQAGRLSDATPIGSVQIPTSGLPILLMVDCQTTGGYPKVGTVISADLPVAGQLAPGDLIQFETCSRDAALAALRAREAGLLGNDG